MDAAMIRAESVVQHIHESLTTPFVVAGTELYVSASMGISLFPQDGTIRAACSATPRPRCIESKKSGPAGYVVSARGVVRLLGKLQFVTKLRKAVEHRRWVAALSAGHRAIATVDDRRRGADPVDRARRHDDPARDSSRSPRSSG